MVASSEFPDAVCLWWIYSCYWNILVVIWGILCLFLALVCVTTVPYCIVSSSEDIAICTVAFVTVVYRCILSALTWNSKILNNKSKDRDSNFIVMFLQQSLKSYWERKRDDSLMLATIRDDTWNVFNVHINPNLKDGIIQSSLVVAINKLKEPPTWLKVATTLKKAPHPHNLSSTFGDMHSAKSGLHWC